MRISDWSSDVCSSDLGLRLGGEVALDLPGYLAGDGLGLRPGLARLFEVFEHLRRIQLEVAQQEGAELAHQPGGAVAGVAVPLEPLRTECPEIGRAHV